MAGQTSSKPAVRHITVSLVLSWAFGVLFLVLGVLLAVGGVVATEARAGIVGLIFVLLGVLLLPSANRWLRTRYQVVLSPGVKALVVVAGLVIALLVISGAKEEPASAGDAVDLRAVLGNWSDHLPTTYRLGEVERVCGTQRTLDQNDSCSPKTRNASSPVLDGYTRAFTIGSASGTGKLVALNSSDAAAQYFANKVSQVKAERGYDELRVRAGCFGWLVDYGVMTQQSVVCLQGRYVYSVGVQEALAATIDVRPLAYAIGDALS